MACTAIGGLPMKSIKRINDVSPDREYAVLDIDEKCIYEGELRLDHPEWVIVFLLYSTRSISVKKAYVYNEYWEPIASLLLLNLIAASQPVFAPVDGFVMTPWAIFEEIYDDYITYINKRTGSPIIDAF